SDGLGLLPKEYAAFLRRHRYLLIDDGTEVGGLDHSGIYYTEAPWLSDQHLPGSPFIVFAKYWRYADGDQLLFEPNNPHSPVSAHLHEHGPLFELFAPSFSRALWRIVHEYEAPDDDWETSAG